MPGNDEYAIGALTEDGEPMMNPEAVGAVPKEELKKLIVKKRLEIKARLAKYRAGQAAWPIKNKIAIIVDDGVATGMTMSAALKSVRAREPKKIVLAVPHGVAESMERLKKTSDEVITFSPPPFYSAVAQSYEEFPQVEDEEVIRILKNSRQIKNR
ncbi:MAG: putative phosphoribosyl transferase [Candidatus Magasanikbacteria bacterium]|nr:putative phosphoribosyl transferase [Candidatus Magasanikbacteria bacterium]